MPPDVWSLDFVFSDTSGSEGGTYDNRDTLDYHVPVKGGMKDGKPTTEVKLHVVSISVEMVRSALRPLQLKSVGCARRLPVVDLGTLLRYPIEPTLCIPLS